MGSKGGGTPSAPKVSIPGNMQTDISNLENLGAYESFGLQEPYNIGNYYMSLATGGAPGTQLWMPSQSQMMQNFPNAPTGLLHTAGSSVYGPGGVAGDGGTAAGGGVTSGAGPVGQQMVTGGEPMLVGAPDGTGQGFYVNNPNLQYPAFVPVAPGEDPAQSLKSYLQTYKGSTYTGAYQGGTTASGAPTSAAPAAAAAPAGAGTQVGGTTFPATQNPYLSEFQQMLAAEYGTAMQIPGIQQATAALGSNISGELNYLGQLAPSQMDQANQMLTGAQGRYQQTLDELAARNQGQLLPGQQAAIDLQVQSAQARMNQQLAGMGLGSSTMGTELGGEMGLLGAATAGQLMQQNIQLAQQDVTGAQQGISLAEAEQQIAQGDYTLLQSAQKLALGTQTLQLGEEQALYQQFQNIGTQSMDAQSTLFQQAMQGYGLAGQFLNQVLAPMNLSMGGFSAILGANQQYAQEQTQLELAQLQSQSQQAQGLGQLFSGLGSIFGGGGGGGGLLGGLLGGAGAAAGGGALAGVGASGASAALGGGGAALAGLAGALAAF